MQPVHSLRGTRRRCCSAANAGEDPGNERYRGSHKQFPRVVGMRFLQLYTRLKKSVP